MKSTRPHIFSVRTKRRRSYQCRAVWSDEDDAYLVFCPAAYGIICFGRSLRAAKRHARVVLGMYGNSLDYYHLNERMWRE